MVATLAVVATGCGDSPEVQARKSAENHAVEKAIWYGDLFAAHLKDYRYGQEREAVDSFLPGAPDVPVFDRVVLARGSVRLGLAVEGRGEAGGGLSYKRITVRMCVSLTGDLETRTIVIADVTCPAGLPQFPRSGGGFDAVVHWPGGVPSTRPVRTRPDPTQGG